MKWDVVFLPPAAEDFKRLAGNQRIQVAKAIEKVRQNPLSTYEGGYGRPLGNKNGVDLTGFLKIKLKAAGIRVVYQAIKTEKQMRIVVIGARADDEVYELAEKRIRKYRL